MMLDLKIKEFLIRLNKNSNLNANLKLSELKISKTLDGYKYPYKPILLIAIITNINDVNLLFNNPILIDSNSPITKTYYDLLTNSETIYNFLTSQTNKADWFLAFNNKVKQAVVKNIFEMPAPKLTVEGFWIVNKKKNTITIKVEHYNQHQLEELKNMLLEKAKACLWKCVPDYKDLSVNEIVDYQEYLQQQLINGVDLINDSTKKSSRKYQHIFSKIITQRDQKCKICCLDLPELLEAAHIKPFCKCEKEIEKYDTNNGILLCCNHHKLFDRGFFSFDDQWRVVISKELKLKDADLLIKTYERCYEQTFQNMPNCKYLQDHFKNIFRG